MNLKFKIQAALENVLKVGVKKYMKPLDDKCIINGTYYEMENKEILIIKESKKREVTNL